MLIRTTIDKASGCKQMQTREIQNGQLTSVYEKVNKPKIKKKERMVKKKGKRKKKQQHFLKKKRRQVMSASNGTKAGYT